MKASNFAFKQGFGPVCKSLPFFPSRQDSLLCRPISPSNSHHRQNFYPGRSPHRNDYSTVNPDEGSHESPDESPLGSSHSQESPDDSGLWSPRSNKSPKESPDELKPSFSPPPLASNRPRLIKVWNILAPHQGHIRVLGLNSPKEKNALSLGLLKNLRLEIRSIMAQKNTHDELGLGPTRVLIVASELGVFSAGAYFKVTEEKTEAKYVRSFLRDISVDFLLFYVWLVNVDSVYMKILQCYTFNFPSYISQFTCVHRTNKPLLNQ